MQVTRKIIFRNGREIHRADDCLPLIHAVDAGEMELHVISRHSYPGVILASDEAPGVCSLGYWKTIGEQRHGLSQHRNEGIELTMSLQGETPVTVEGRGYRLRPGELMVTRPWQVHSVGNPVFAPGKLGWLILDVGVRHPHQEWKWPSWVMLTAAELEALSRSLRQNEDVICPVPEVLSETFERMVRIAKSPGVAHRGSKVVMAVNALLMELLELFESRPVCFSPALTDASRSVRFFLEELSTRLAEPWSVRSMAEACGLGVTHFTRHFQLVAGESPAQHLLGLRLEAASRRLRDEPGVAISEVARQVGFPHANYFSRVFMRRYGCTPAVWRNQDAKHPKVHPEMEQGQGTRKK
jgi:AraC family L-rhamnose operon regulatory protein RhaS